MIVMSVVSTHGCASRPPAFIQPAAGVRIMDVSLSLLGAMGSSSQGGNRTCPTYQPNFIRIFGSPELYAVDEADLHPVVDFPPQQGPPRHTSLSITLQKVQ